MKKIFVAIIAVTMSFILFGCGYNKTEVDKENNDGRMSLIYNDGFVIIYVDNETGVQYFSRANCGSCVMVDEYGKPYIKR